MSRQIQQGVAMVIVLWVLSLLTIMAGSFALTMRREITVVSAVKNNAMLLANAKSGIALAQKMLSLSDKQKRWRADGSIYQWIYQDQNIRIRLFSEQGKIDINRANKVLLTTLLGSTSMDEDKQAALVGAMIDWRDKDDRLQPEGAEKKQYEEAGLSYRPTNKPFQSINELQMVLGMNVDIYQQLQPLITVHSKQANVDVNVAAKAVLEVVSEMELEILSEYLRQRIENNQAQLPAPAFPLSNQAKTKRTDAYTVMIEVEGDEGYVRIKTLLRRAKNNKNPFKILGWQQVYQGLSLFSEEAEQFLVTENDESI